MNVMILYVGSFGFISTVTDSDNNMPLSRVHLIHNSDKSSQSGHPKKVASFLNCVFDREICMCSFSFKTTSKCFWHGKLTTFIPLLTSCVARWAGWRPAIA